MTERSATPRRSIDRLRLISGAAAVVVVAVLAGIYGMERLRSNPAATACAQATATGNRVAPLVHGEVAALVVARNAFQVPNLTFNDAEGHQRKLADWRGRTVLLNLWATWCVPCRREMPALDALEGNLGGANFEVIAIDIDTRDPDKPLAFLKEIGVSHLAYYADQSARVFQDLKAAGKAFGMPTTLIIDPNGCEIGEMAGPAQWSSPEGVKLVSAAIGNAVERQPAVH